MSRLTNNTGISLSMAVWLAEDKYDHNDDPNTISATTLIKPVKQIILGTRVPVADSSEDIAERAASRVGTDVHTGVEHAWLNNYRQSMKALGYPNKVIDFIRINPTSRDLQYAADNEEDIIPIYMEQRSHRKVGNITVSGKYDFVAEGVLEDIKNTSTYTYVNKSNDVKYKLQGSIYRWLNPTIITADTMLIQFVFSDWKAMLAKTDKSYPPHKVMAYPVQLMSVADTERYVRSKVGMLSRLWTSPESDMPECTDEDLWRTDPVFKYYKNPQKTTRSTKNGPTMQEANSRLLDDKSVGIVLEVPGEVKACRYCSAFPVCKQKDSYIASGVLKL